MTNMFKKSLLATALLSAGVVNAAVLNPTDPTTPATAGQVAPLLVSSQYLDGNATVAPSHSATVLNANAVTLVLQAEYTNNDTFTLTFSAPLAAAMPTAITTQGGSTNEVTFGLISGGTAGDSTATYRVTSLLNAVTTVGEYLQFNAGQIKFAKAAAKSGVTVSFAAQTNNGLPLDTSGGARRSATLVKVVDQFVKKVDPTFNRVIDVGAQRKSFVDLSGDKTVTGTISITEDADLVAANKRAVSSIKHTINGNFSWVRDTDANTPGIQYVANTFVVTGCVYTPTGSPALTATSLTFTCENFGDVDVTIDPELQKTGAPTGWVAPAIPHHTLTATSEATFTGPAGSEKLFDNATVGVWSLNGSSVHIPYMPYGDNITQVINLNNAGTQTGDISVEAIDRTGTKYGPIVIGSAQTGRQVALAESIKNALIGAGMPANERASITLVTNVPAADVTVYSAYNVNGTGARIVVNDSNGK